jgi:hypothetical protein
MRSGVALRFAGPSSGWTRPQGVHLGVEYRCIRCVDSRRCVYGGRSNVRSSGPVSPESKDGQNEYKPGVLNHPSHLLCRAPCCGDNEIALIFAGLIVHYDDEFATRHGCNCALYRVERKGGTNGRCTLFRCSAGRRREIGTVWDGPCVSKGGILGREGECGLLEDSDWGHDYRVERSGVGRC